MNISISLFKLITLLSTNMLCYYGFHVLGFIGVFIFGYFYAKKFGFKPIKTIAFIILTYGTLYIFIYVQCWVESGFKNWGGNNIVRGFVYLPLIALPYYYLFKFNQIENGYKKMLDFVAPLICISHGISHFGCLFVGCCHGYQWEYGIYNPQTECNTFPIQIIEAIVALIIAFVVIFYTNKTSHILDTKKDLIKKEDKDLDKQNCLFGKAYPLMLILFGSTRYIFEFFRDNKKVFLNCSVLAFHALFMFFVGLIWFLFFTNPNKEKKI